MRPVPRCLIPSPIREIRYRLRRIGFAKFLAYRRLERVEQRKPAPRAGACFDIGGASFVPHETTLNAIRSHWIKDGHAILEFGAFKREARSHQLLLDIGAAEGIYSAAFGALTGQPSWAFEPSEEMFARLTALSACNPGLEIHPVHSALGAEISAREFRFYPDGQISGSAPANGENEPTLKLEVTTVDAFVAMRGLVPDFAKIDVEGMELDVLRGGTRTFGTLVRTIMLEVHYDALVRNGQSSNELQAVLRSLGFSVETLSGEPIGDLEAYARANPEPLPGYTFVICRRGV